MRPARVAAALSIGCRLHERDRQKVAVCETAVLGAWEVRNPTVSESSLNEIKFLLSHSCWGYESAGHADEFALARTLRGPVSDFSIASGRVEGNSCRITLLTRF